MKGKFARSARKVPQHFENCFAFLKGREKMSVIILIFALGQLSQVFILRVLAQRLNTKLIFDPWKQNRLRNNPCP